MDIVSERDAEEEELWDREWEPEGVAEGVRLRVRDVRLVDGLNVAEGDKVWEPVLVGVPERVGVGVALGLRVPHESEALEAVRDRDQVTDEGVRWVAEAEGLGSVAVQECDSERVRVRLMVVEGDRVRVADGVRVGGEAVGLGGLGDGVPVGDGVLVPVREMEMVDVAVGVGPGPVATADWEWVRVVLPVRVPVEVGDMDREGVALGDEYVEDGVGLQERVREMDGVEVGLRVDDRLPLREGSVGLLVPVRVAEDRDGEGLQVRRERVAVRERVNGGVVL